MQIFMIFWVIDHAGKYFFLRWVPEMSENSSLKSSFLLHTCFSLLKGPQFIIKNVNYDMAHNIQLSALVKWDSKFQLILTQRKKRIIDLKISSYIIK